MSQSLYSFATHSQKEYILLGRSINKRIGTQHLNTAPLQMALRAGTVSTVFSALWFSVASASVIQRL